MLNQESSVNITLTNPGDQFNLNMFMQEINKWLKLKGIWIEKRVT